jgi:alpha-beta hydrolase superfamily lysophospholipase
VAIWARSVVVDEKARQQFKITHRVARIRKIMFLFGVLAGSYAALVGAIYLGQRRIIYPAPSLVVEPTIDDADLETVEVPEAPPVYGLHFHAPEGAPTILHFHGNGEQLADLIGLGRALRSAGLGFFALEYPGYGVARKGKASEEANYAAGEAAVRHIEKQHGLLSRDLVLQGQSLGTGIALELARRGHGRKLVLISPYTSMVAMGKLAVPIFPGDWLIRDRYENLKKAPDLELPVLVVHGTLDEVIPHSMGDRVSHAIPKARFVSVAGGHHNDLFVLHGRTLMETIRSFIHASG